jgi:hypothetical protein
VGEENGYMTPGVSLIEYRHESDPYSADALDVF